MNIIRVKLPEKTQRFKPFTVEDYRNLLLIRNEIESNPLEETEILSELLEELYPQYSPLEREYIFIQVLLTSLGKSIFEVVYCCPECNKSKKFLLNLSQPPLKRPILKSSNITFTFNFPKHRSKNYSKVFYENIQTVSDGTETINWDALDENTKTSLVDLISFEEFGQLVEKFNPISVNHTVECCGKKQHINYNTVLDVFSLLVNPEEIFGFYKINRLLIRNDYSHADIMHMLPIERNIALTLIEKEIKEKNAAANRLS